MSVPADNPARSQPNETSPLLHDASRGRENGAIERQEQPGEESDNEVPLANVPSTSRAIVILGGVWVGVFLAALDSTIIATLSGPVASSFNSFSLLSWLASAYLIANAALQPLSGRLTDIFGRRAGLIFSNIFFAAGNLICGLARSESVMILGRVVAGMGGGGLTAISTFVTTDLIPLRNRGLWQGFGNICFGLGMGLGGVFGGWINDVWGWRKAFLIQVPFVVVSGILVAFTVKIPVKEKNMSRIGRVDFLGALTLVASLVLLLLGLNSGGNSVPWKHPLVLVSLPLSGVFLLAFIYVEDRIASEPVIPVRLLLHRTVACGCLTNWFCTMASFMLMFYGPIYYEVLGWSSTQAGLRMIPISVGAAAGSLGVGIITKGTGRYYLLNLVVEATLLLSFALVAGLLDQHASVAPPFIFFLLAGFGYGGMLTITLLALISAVDHEHQAVITSASYAFRSTGSTIGITIASAVFQNILKAELWQRFGNRPGAAEVISRIRDSIDEIQRVPPGWKDGVLESYMSALKGVWYTTLGIGMLGAVISLGMREHTLHKTLDRR